MRTDQLVNSGFTEGLTSIIIVSWNVAELLHRCLRSIEPLRNTLDLEVIVVDGASTDGSREMVVSNFDWVTLLPCSTNVGFPKGNNIGINQTAGENILLLNPDTEIVGDSLVTLLNYLRENDNVAVVGPQLLNSDGSIQSSRRRFPDLWVGLLESTWLESKAPKKVLRNYYYEDSDPSEVTEVDWLTGACLLARRQVLAEIGLLDEEYFMYSEELDWCRRVRDAGWKIVYVPGAKVIHHIGKSSEQAVTDRHINFNRAKLRYFRKYHGSLAATLLRIVILANFAFQLLLELVKGIIGHKRALRWQRVASYWQVLRSGMRPAGY